MMRAMNVRSEFHDHKNSDLSIDVEQIQNIHQNKTKQTREKSRALLSLLHYHDGLNSISLAFIMFYQFNRSNVNRTNVCLQRSRDYSYWNH